METALAMQMRTVLHVRLIAELAPSVEMALVMQMRTVLHVKLIAVPAAHVYQLTAKKRDLAALMVSITTVTIL